MSRAFLHQFLLLLSCSCFALDDISPGREPAVDNDSMSDEAFPSSSYSQLVVWGAWSFRGGGGLQQQQPPVVVPKPEQIYLGPRDLCASLSHHDDDVTVVLKSSDGAAAGAMRRLSSFVVPEARQVAFNGYDVVVLSKGGQVVSSRSNGGTLPHLGDDRAFTSVYSSRDGSFAALSESGRVSTWGAGLGQQATRSWRMMSDRATAAAGGEEGAGDDGKVAAEALDEGVYKVFGLDFGFAALRNDSSLVVWGDEELDSALGCPGERLRPPSRLFGGAEVVEMLEAQSRFFALLQDGTALAWGCIPRLDAMLAHQELRDVEQIARTGFAFAALHTDGSVSSWGSQWSGGNPDTEAAVKLSGSVTALCGECGGSVPSYMHSPMHMIHD